MTDKGFFGLDDDDCDFLQGDVEQQIEEGNRKYGYGGRKLELLSVEQALRKDSGTYAVTGMIIGISSVEHIVMSTEFGCSNCENGAYERKHNPPLFSLPYHLNLNKIRKCDACESMSFGPKKHNEKAIIRIQLQDEKKQNLIENLTVVLFEDDTLNIRNGEKVVITGTVHIIQQPSKNSRRVSYLFADEKGLSYERPDTAQVHISERDLSDMNEFVKQPRYLERLAAMFAPTIIGEEIKKLGIIVMYVGAPETEDFRGRIHGLFVGNPGTAKSKLAWQAKKLGEPNSRYSSMEGSSAQSLGVIIDKEGDSYIVRSGILPQAKGSLCILNEIAALSMDDQRQLLTVMEEGLIPKDKYAFHREIESPTTVLGTLNPRQTDWYFDIIDKEQIPLRRELIDRYDLIFVFKDVKDKDEKERYARQKLTILKDSFNGNISAEAEYTFLRKIIQHAKEFQPTEISEEAEAMLVEYWLGLDSKTFPTKRVLDVIVRVSMAFARLHFSNVVTGEIAKKALDFLTDVFGEFDASVAIVEDPRETICKEIASFYMENPNMPFDFSDTVNIVKVKNTMLDTYLGNGSGLDTQSRKYRDLRERFLESPPVVDGLISISSHNPLTLVFKVEKKDAHSHYIKESGGQGPKQSKQKQESSTEPEPTQTRPRMEQESSPSPFGYLIAEKSFPNIGRYHECKEHPDKWSQDLKGLIESHFKPHHRL